MGNSIDKQPDGQQDRRQEQNATGKHQHPGRHRPAQNHTAAQPEQVPRDIKKKGLVKPHRSEGYHGTAKQRVAEEHAKEYGNNNPEGNQLALFAGSNGTHVGINQHKSCHKEKKEYKHVVKIVFLRIQR